MLPRGTAWRSVPIALSLLALLFHDPVSALRTQARAPAPVRIELAPLHEHYRERVEQAAAESLRLYTEWLGSSPSSLVRIASARSQNDRDTAETILLHLPWRTADSAMEIQSLVAYSVAKRYWTAASEEPAIAHGLAWYLQARVVEYLFNLRYAVPGHSTESLRFFGGHVPWALPSLRISRWATNRPLSQDSRRRPADVDEDTLRGAMAFATLERYLGWPVLQGALAALTARSGSPLTSTIASSVIGAAAGQDLTWFFAVAFDRQRRIEYRLQELVSEMAPETCGTPCYRTRVTVTRLGNAALTGSTRLPVDGFEAGSAIRVQVQFDDGQIVTASWDGRDEQRVFEFDSAARASVAQLDPDGTLLLDPNSLDHRLSRVPTTNMPVAKWIARWGTWLQHALLTYAMLM